MEMLICRATWPLYIVESEWWEERVGVTNPVEEEERLSGVGIGLRRQIGLLQVVKFWFERTETGLCDGIMWEFQENPHQKKENLMMPKLQSTSVWSLLEFSSALK